MEFTTLKNESALEETDVVLEVFNKFHEVYTHYDDVYFPQRCWHKLMGRETFSGKRTKHGCNVLFPLPLDSNILLFSLFFIPDYVTTYFECQNQMSGYLVRFRIIQSGKPLPKIYKYRVIKRNKMGAKKGGD